MRSASRARGIWRLPVWAIALGGLGTLAAASAAAGAEPHYHLIKSVLLGGASGWDYITLDPETRRLFITRGTHVMVVNAGSGRLVGDIGGMKGIHGVAFAHGRGYITDGGSDSVVVFDRRTLKKLRNIPVGRGPDGIFYDPFSDRIFAIEGRGEDVTAIDARTGRVAGMLPLGGRPEAGAADGHGMAFINIVDQSEVVAFNSKTLTIVRRWSLAPCMNPSGMAIDAAHERIFSGCRNGVMAVSDTRAGKVIATVPIGQGVDSNRFDPAQGLAFSSNGVSGTLTVVREIDPDSYQVLENVPTARSARTMELDPATHRVYLIAAELKFPAGPPQQPAARPPQSPAGPPLGRRFVRPSVVPGTFRLLILAP
jgi:YVTN family beta-propeller protein